MGCTLSVAKRLDGESIATTEHTRVKTDLPFPKEGVTLDVFDQFIAHAGGKKALKDLTTTEVCNKFLKALTAEKEESYCDQLKRQGSKHVGSAHLFVSHAWKYRFLDVVSAIRHHIKDDREVFIWFDLFR